MQNQRHSMGVLYTAVVRRPTWTPDESIESENLPNQRGRFTARRI
jgi:hypothetical protein